MAKGKKGIANPPPKTHRVGISLKPGTGYSRVPAPSPSKGSKK
jgi:hypothetical protein